MELHIQRADVDDAAELMDFVQTVDGETEFLLREPGEFSLSLDEERNYIEEILHNP